MAEKRRRCQSKSRYGDCWLWQDHDGDEHAVPIGDLGERHPEEMRQLDADTRAGFWFVYPKRGTKSKPSYAYWEEGDWVRV